MPEIYAIHIVPVAYANQLTKGKNAFQKEKYRSTRPGEGT